MLRIKSLKFRVTSSGTLPTLRTNSLEFTLARIYHKLKGEETCTSQDGIYVKISTIAENQAQLIKVSPYIIHG